MNTEQKINQILENQKLIMKEIGFIEEILKSLLVNNILTTVQNPVDTKEEIKKVLLGNEKAKCNLIGKYARVKEKNNIRCYNSNGIAVEPGGYFRQHFCLQANEISDYNPISNRVELHFISKKNDYSFWFDLNDIVVK